MKQRLVIFPLLLTLVGCAPTLDVDVALCPEMPTVVEVSWTRTSSEPVWVDYGEEGRWRAHGPAGEAGERARVLVGGAKPGELLTLEAFEGAQRSGPEAITTGVLLDAPTDLQVSSSVEDDGRWLLTTAMGNFGEFGAGVVLYDRDGQVVWYYPLPQGRLAITAVPALSGEGFWVLSQSIEPLSVTPEGRLMRVGLDGVVEVDRSLPEAHHAIAQTREGAVLVNERSMEEDIHGESFPGQRIVEVAADGEVKELLNLQQALMLNLAPEDGERPHANGLSYDPVSGNLLWSVIGYAAVIAFDGESGQLQWSVSDLDVGMRWPTGVNMPVLHAPSYGLDGELLIFDNGEASGTAQVRAFEVSPELGRVEERWSYARAEGQSVTAMGHAAELEDGHLLISWGTRGELEELDEDREMIWLGATPLGEATGNVHRLDSLAPAP